LFNFFGACIPIHVFQVGGITVYKNQKRNWELVAAVATDAHTIIMIGFKNKFVKIVKLNSSLFYL
jgi:hypothetical protein